MARTPLKVIPGERQGPRVVIRQVPPINGSTAVLVRCDCGLETEVVLSRLRARGLGACRQCKSRDERPRLFRETAPQLGRTGPEREGYVTYTIDEWREMMRVKKSSQG